jgi:hypothetical protein
VLVLKLKILDLKLPFYPCFTSIFSKSVQQFQKPVQPELKPVQSVSALFHSVTASLPVSPVRKKACADFWKNGSTEFWPGSTGFATGSTEFWPGSTGFATGSTEFWSGSTEFESGLVFG